jgi:hypothetical protein
MVYRSIPTGIPISGPVDLETLSVAWHVSDDPNEPGSCLKHLYELIRPSLDTLVELSIVDHDPDSALTATAPHFLDLRRLRGRPCHDMRKVTYKTYGPDAEALFAFADVFPNLIELDVTIAGKGDMLGVAWSVRTYY